MTNLAENLVVAATVQPHHVALRCDDLAVSFADFNDAAARVATLLARAGVQPGDRVGVVLPNTLAFAIVFYGIMHRGAVAVPMNPLLKAGEIEFHLSNTGAAALFATPVFAAEARTAAAAADVEQCWIVDDMSLGELIAELPRHAGPLARNDTDTAVILHTSRTTGRPKGAELTHGGLHRNADVTARTLIEIGPSDVVIGSLPLFHVFGLTAALNASVLAGATLTLIERFDPHRALEVIERDRVTGSIGTPIEGVEMRVVDSDGNPLAAGEVGEIQIRGHNVMTGYLNQPGATSEAITPDGWFSTGDIGRADEDGYYYIVDRAKDLIIRGGYNVYPREVEEILYQHPAVAEAAVIGIPHPTLGEEIGAAVTLKQHSRVGCEDLRDFIKDRLAAYKYPRRVWFVESLPKGATGKILRREITIPTSENTP